MQRNPTSDARFEVRQCPVEGRKSLHTLHPFEPGDTLVSFGAQATFSEPTVHSIQVNASQHILVDPEFLRYTNHSCSPNVAFDLGHMVVTAIQPIRPEDEIVYYYPSTERAMVQPFACTCRSEQCLGWVHGAERLPTATLSRYHLAPHILTLLEERSASTLIPDLLCKA